jgi:GDPmannose 4,6-dehydratase
VGYFFHHDSPWREEKHINQKIVKAVQRIKRGSNEIIEIGNLTVKKEFNFAGDLMEAVWGLINQEQYFEAVIGSGKAYSLENWLAVCFQFIGKNYKDYVKVNPDYKADFTCLYSNPAIMLSLGWKPKIDFVGLAKLMLGL